MGKTGGNDGKAAASEGGGRAPGPEEVASFTSRMAEHGFQVDHLGEGRFRIRHFPHESSRLVIQVDAREVTVVEVTEDFIRHYFARSGRTTLKKFITGKLRESGIVR